VSRIEWSDYLDRFHAERAGITEVILTSCRAEHITPYEWLGKLFVPPMGVVLDLACGSGPMHQQAGPGWFGVDRSLAELTVAHRVHQESHLLLADANALPLRSGCADIVVCCMGLMVMSSIDPVLHEVERAAGQQARLAALLPATSPLTLRDRLRYARLLATLHLGTFRYPNPTMVKDPRRSLQGARFTVTHESRKRFSYPIKNEKAANAFVDSLYTPRVPATRLENAKRLARHWIGTDIGIPLRRILARPA
jgi:SAM-dependent methyltransferase